MVYSKIQIGSQEIKLKPLFAGEDASFSDYSNPNSEIFIVKCKNDSAEVWISKSGYSIEVEDIREANSFDLKLETKFTGQYRRNITTKFGEAILILKYSN